MSPGIFSLDAVEEFVERYTDIDKSSGAVPYNNFIINIFFWHGYITILLFDGDVVVIIDNEVSGQVIFLLTIWNNVLNRMNKTSPKAFYSKVQFCLHMRLHRIKTDYSKLCN